MCAKRGAYQMDKETLSEYINRGMSIHEISRETGISWWNLSYYVKVYNLGDDLAYGKNNLGYIDDFFHKIDTKEKAYILGFLLGDGCIDKEGRLDVSLALSDRQILDFIVDNLGGRIRVDETINVKQRKYPKASVKIGNKAIVRDLHMLFGGRLKPERHIPIIKKELEAYLLQGFFDAEGCVSFGTKKSSQRWYKVTFTSQLKMLEGIQRILVKRGIASVIRPKGTEKCYVMEIRSTDKIKQISDIIYSNHNFVVLQRKYDKLMALRLELGENGETR